MGRNVKHAQALGMLLVFAFHSFPQTQKEPEGKLYAPKEARFEVRFPVESSVRKSPLGSETIFIAGVQRKKVDELAYICQWLILAKPHGDEEAVKAYLIGQQAGSLLGLKGSKLLSEKEISLEANLGREFIIEASKQDLLRCRVYVAGKRVINIQVWGRDREAVDSENATRFFNSLKIEK